MKVAKYRMWIKKRDVMECYIHCYVELLYLTVILLYLDMIIRYD